MRTEITTEQRDALRSYARISKAISDRLLQSGSETDRVDSEYWFAESRVYEAVAMGRPLEEALAAADKRWRLYAAYYAKGAVNPIVGRKSTANPPCRWVNPDRFAAQSPSIRQMIARVMTRKETETA